MDAWATRRLGGGEQNKNLTSAFCFTGVCVCGFVETAFHFAP